VQEKTSHRKESYKAKHGSHELGVWPVYGVTWPLYPLKEQLNLD
jgi:hypothetical protein